MTLKGSRHVAWRHSSTGSTTSCGTDVFPVSDVPTSPSVASDRVRRPSRAPLPVVDRRRGTPRYTRRSPRLRCSPRLRGTSAPSPMRWRYLKRKDPEWRRRPRRAPASARRRPVPHWSRHHRDRGRPHRTAVCRSSRDRGSACSHRPRTTSRDHLRHGGSPRRSPLSANSLKRSTVERSPAGSIPHVAASSSRLDAFVMKSLVFHFFGLIPGRRKASG